jgi:hypothetical protein
LGLALTRHCSASIGPPSPLASSATRRYRGSFIAIRHNLLYHLVHTASSVTMVGVAGKSRACHDCRKRRVKVSMMQCYMASLILYNSVITKDQHVGDATGLAVHVQDTIRPPSSSIAHLRNLLLLHQRPLPKRSCGRFKRSRTLSQDSFKLFSDYNRLSRIYPQAQ